jgi:sigma-B regulation protein RsbU (phosphoserine phosphatase)
MAGHGAQAAAQAAGLRFGWRTLVAVNPNPAAVLAALNVQMSNPDLRAEGLFASMVYVLIDPRGGISVAPAGHPAPLLLTADGCRIMEPSAVGPLLGIRDEADWPVSHGFLPPGGTLVLYTDGLVEARRGGSDVFGADRACLVLEAERRAALEARVERLIDAARRHDDEHLRDDVVVLAVERPRPLSPGAENGRPRRGRVPLPRPADEPAPPAEIPPL